MGISILWVPETNSVYIGDVSRSPNPLLQYLAQADQKTPPFEEIKPAHFIPALEYSMAAERLEIAKIINNPDEPSFANTIEPLQRMNLCDQISSILFAMSAAENNDALQEVSMEAGVLLSNHGNDIIFNEALFSRVASVYQQTDKQNLTAEQATLLENTYRGFVDNGVNLTAQEQDRMRQIDGRLATLSGQFSANLLTDTNASYLLITDKKELSGLPDNLVELAAQEAKNRSMAGWCFPMDDSTVDVFMSFADNREKRREMAQKSRAIGMLTPETDNRGIVKEIVNLRLQKANILGYPTYADAILNNRMVNNKASVMEFLDNLVAQSLPAAQENIQEIEQYAQSKGLQGSLEVYDLAYYKNQLRQEKYSFDEEALQ